MWAVAAAVGLRASGHREQEGGIKGHGNDDPRAGGPTTGRWEHI